MCAVTDVFYGRRLSAANSKRLDLKLSTASIQYARSLLPPPFLAHWLTTRAQREVKGRYQDVARVVATRDGFISH